MSYYLIDLENVGIDGLNGIEDLKGTDNVVIFHNKEQANSKITLKQCMEISTSNANIEYIEIKSGTPNALDMQLASQLGFFVATTNTAYYIVSKDTGYDCLRKYWSKNNRQVLRVTSIKAVFELKDKKKEEGKEEKK